MKTSFNNCVSEIIRLACIASVVTLLLAFLLCVPSPAQDKKSVGTLTATAFTRDSGGGRLIVPGASVELTGQTQALGVTDPEGKFTFVDLPPGTYTLTATAPDLTASLQVTVAEGVTTQADVEMTVAAVKESTTVTASAETVDTKEPSGTNSIGESTVKNMPNINEKFDSLLPLVPGVVRGPSGTINLKGARATESGALVNSADVTDPVTGAKAINIPIDVVSSVQVLSTPYDPEYGRFTGAVANVETRAGSFNGFRFSAQNFLPRVRKLGDSIMGIEAATPRMTFSMPIVKDKIAFTESFEYRYERYPVDSLPKMQRDTQTESFESYSQFDLNISPRQTATASFAVFPQKLNYFGLNTFTPQASTPDVHSRGYQAYLQDRYITASSDLVTSQFSFRRFDTDVLPNGTGTYQLLVDTTEGSFFNRQRRDTTRVEWSELFQSHPHQFHGSHQFVAGVEYAHSSYDGRQEFLPVQIVGVQGSALENISFGPKAIFNVDQDELAWFVGDKWSLNSRLSLDLGARFDRDGVTDSINPAPRAGFVLALTKDGRTLLKGGAGFFLARVPLNVASFLDLPDRTISYFDPEGNVLSSMPYHNAYASGLRNPRSEVWNLEVDREVTSNLLLRVGYQQRNTVHDFYVSPVASGSTSELLLYNGGRSFYREFQLGGRYRIHNSTVNASYVRSKAYGDLNDFNQFFGNNPVAVIQPNQRGPLNFDDPNRVLAWAEIAAPYKLTVSPVLDVHTGFPYSTIEESREFVGPRNELRYPRFASADIQVLRTIGLPFKEKHARVGLAVYNVFNHFNPRDVQNDLQSSHYSDFYNGVGRTFRGKFVLEF